MLFRDEANTVTVGAPAKLNLFLEVLGRRTDGFHELETLMVTVGLHDTLRFVPNATGELRLTCIDARSRHRPGAASDPLPLSSGADNLVMRAALLLKETTGTNSGADIQLFTRIPLAAGLAGGSSDAAATLAGLNRLWKLGLSASDLQQLAAKLGSDIPFFLASEGTGAAVCRGRGELIEPVRLPHRMHFVVVRPRSGLSTADVFKHCRPGSSGKRVENLVCALQQGRLHTAASSFHNSLQPAAEILNADVTQMKQAFERLPFIGHLMSGSGTSYYGLCGQRDQAAKLAARLKGARLGDVMTVQSRP